jgi:ribosomal protein S18 acetylase RimI-like enzyme
VVPDLSARCAEATPAQARAGATGAAHRAVGQAGPVLLTDLGTGTRWGVRALDWGDGATDDNRKEALTWCAIRAAAAGAGAAGFEVSLPAPSREWERLGLVEVDRLPALATTAAVAAAITGPEPAGLDIRQPRSVDEVVESYGGWMDDRPLAARLVVEADLRRTDRVFLVARVDGELVGCGQVWFVAGTAYLSGIGIVEDQRGQGYGAALTAAAARLAARGPHGGPPPDVVWLHASAMGAPVYRRLGFEPAGEDVRLAPA